METMSADNPRRPGPRDRQRRKRRDAFSPAERAAAKDRRWKRQRDRRAERKREETGYQSGKRAAERRRFQQRKGRRRRSKNNESVERDFIAGGFYVAAASELQRPTFVIVGKDGHKRWETLKPDLA